MDWSLDLFHQAGGPFLQPDHVLIVGRGNPSLCNQPVRIFLERRRGPRIQPALDFRMTIHERQSSGTIVITGRVISRDQDRSRRGWKTGHINKTQLERFPPSKSIKPVTQVEESVGPGTLRLAELAYGMRSLPSWQYINHANDSWRMLFKHWIPCAFVFVLPNTGSSSAASIAIIAMTTRSSINVNAGATRGDWHRKRPNTQPREVIGAR